MEIYITFKLAALSHQNNTFFVTKCLIDTLFTFCPKKSVSNKYKLKHYIEFAHQTILCWAVWSPHDASSLVHNHLTKYNLQLEETKFNPQYQWATYITWRVLPNLWQDKCYEITTKLLVRFVTIIAPLIIIKQMLSNFISLQNFEEIYPSN